MHRGPDVVHRPIPKGDLDFDAVKIVQRLTRFDHGAYLVGGCVRDLLLDQRPKDFDVATSATPRQIKRLFRNSRIIGRRFRLAHIYFQNGKVIEVATFRARDDENGAASDGGSSDLLIRDDNQFGTPEEDALRRDFTINALFYDVDDGNVLDHADGLGDLRRRLVRTIGDPEIRFREDPIRILRAIKFAARLDFEIEAGTLEALRRLRGEIPKAAAPRILEEINRFCRGGAARRSFELMKTTEVLDVVLPEVARAYDEHPTAWPLLLELLDVIDGRQAADRETGTGEILAVLLIPALGGRLGWSRDGTAAQPRGVNVRDVTDSLLRPIALRLRLARKDQERCRQILMTLFRMVPARKLRRNTMRAILQRECLSGALWILEGLGGRLGGQFLEASKHWQRAAAEERPGDSRRSDSTEGRTAERRPPRSRGGRRGGRRQSAQNPAERAAAPRPADRPQQVDDDYFFSALPSVPSMAGEENAGDRYGAQELAPAREPDARPDDSDERPREQASTADDAAPKPRRRRRSRRRRGARSSERTDTADTDTDPSD